jgi:hypothetical protein
MKKYFKREAESGLGKGTVYLEFDCDWATRQVEVYGDRWFDSTREYHPELGPALVDPPLSVLDLKPEQGITAQEFEEIWKKAMSKNGRRA